MGELGELGDGAEKITDYQHSISHSSVKHKGDISMVFPKGQVIFSAPSPFPPDMKAVNGETDEQQSHVFVGGMNVAN